MSKKLLIEEKMHSANKREHDN